MHFGHMLLEVLAALQILAVPIAAVARAHIVTVVVVLVEFTEIRKGTATTLSLIAAAERLVLRWIMGLSHVVVEAVRVAKFHIAFRAWYHLALVPGAEMLVIFALGVLILLTNITLDLDSIVLLNICGFLGFVRQWRGPFQKGVVLTPRA